MSKGKNPRKLIAIGDSSVYGWGDSEGGGWCERLRQDWMRIPHAPIIYPLGIRGDGIERVASRWRQEWNIRGELRRQVPDGILLSIGLNDIACIGRPDGRPQLSVDAFRFGFHQLTVEIKSKTSLMVMGLTAVDEEVMPFAGCLWYSNKAASIYEAQIEEACLDANVPFLSLHKEMLKEEHWLQWLEPDGIHLNSQGHQWIHNKVSNWSSLLHWAELQPTASNTPLKL